MKFSLQIVSPEKLPIDDTVLHVESELDIWSSVASWAHRLRHMPNARIRVQDSSGGILVQTSVRAALLVSQEPEQPAA